MVKENAPELLRKELASAKWKPQVVVMSGVTDCYQPIERKLKITRRCLEVFHDFRNPVAIITKNFLVTRDIDILHQMAEYNGSAVNVSVTTLTPALATKLEPRAPLPEARLSAIKALSDAGVPVGVMAAPMIPGLNDHEMPKILQAAADAERNGQAMFRCGPFRNKRSVRNMARTPFSGAKREDFESNPSRARRPAQ